MLDWISTMGEVWPSMTPEQVLGMDALYSVELCAALVRRRQAQGKAAPATNQWQERPDGSRSMRVTSMDGLKDFLKGK